MHRRDFLKSISVAAAAPALPAAASGKPNIVLIVADDLGYGELSCQGAKDISTPNIDSIARGGVRFTNGYVSCPVCSPTRAGLMTGRYQQRFGHEFNPGPEEQAQDQFGLPLTETTIANRLKSLGYATGMVGKWHLGYKPELHPMKRGFDEFFGFLGGAHQYLETSARRTARIMRGTEIIAEKEYLTDAFAREAVAFVDRRKAAPFFLYLPFNAVHAPLEAIEKYLDRFASVADLRRRTFLAMQSAMDDAAGRVLSKLRQEKLEENTLIFFISDNGGPTLSTSSGNGPLRGYKGMVLEGGIRVPYMVQWKGRIPAGKVYDQPVISLDIHPTAVAAAGGSIPASAKLDGVNLLPHLAGKAAGQPHEALFWRFGPQGAVRKGNWKIDMLAGAAPQLFNLAEDIGEARNLASAQPEKLKELKAAYDAWNSQLAEPRWQTRREGKKADARKKKR